MTTTLYRAYDAADRLLYVGITDRLFFERLAEHSALYPVGGGWTDYMTTVRFTRYDDRKTAMAAESAAIRGEDPVFNRHGRPFERLQRWMVAYPDRHADDITREDIEQQRRDLDELCAKALAAMSGR